LLLATVLWDRKVVQMVKFMQQETTMSQVYCETLKTLRRVIQNKRLGMLTFGVMLLHDNMLPHPAVRTRSLREHFNWELFDHPPYGPDLTPSDYQLFTYLKNRLLSQRFNYNEALIEGVKTWLSSQEAALFDTGVQNLFPDATSAQFRR
jgi:hypothetical protein